MKILVPMSGHTKGLHDGHRALIAYAQTLGDATIRILPDYEKTLLYARTGLKFPGTENVSKQINDLEAAGIKWETKGPLFTSESRRREAQNKAWKILLPIAKKLLIQRYIDLVLSMLTMKFLSDERHKYDLIARGPEIPLFIGFIGDIARRTKSIFLKEIIKDENGLKLGSIAIGDEGPNIQKAIGQVKCFLKPGRNSDLIREINQSISENWKMEEALLFEGDFIPGRAEVFSFRLADGRLFEDCTFYG